jgi:hypothetical protein
VKSSEYAVSFGDKNEYPSALLFRTYESGSVDQAKLLVAATRYVYPRHALTTPVFEAQIGV